MPEAPPAPPPAPVATAAAPPTAAPRAVPILGCDGFLLALDSLMRRSGQGSHLSQSVLELGGPPDRARLDAAWMAFVRDHPMVVARLSRSWRNGLPVWRVPSPDSAKPMPITWWHEPEVAGGIGDEIDSLEALCHHLRHSRSTRRVKFNIRLDVLQRRDSKAALVATWSHLLLDGKGVEFLLEEVGLRCGQDALGDGAADAGVPGAPSLLAGKPPSKIRDQIERSRAFVEHFYKLATTKFQSLSGPKPTPGDIHCRVVTLDREASARTIARSEKLSGPLISGPFFLAAAAVAHARVFELRGLAAGPQVITLPLQTRPKGGRGPIFQNFVTILFFRLASEELATVEAATKAVQTQFLQMMRTRLDASFTMMLNLMRWLPPRAYSFFLRRQMRGEITSFFHSYTGAFAPELKRLAGAEVEGAWHIPVISTPPGTGLFLGDRDGRLTISMSWREGSINAQEQKLLLDGYIEALTGEPAGSLTINLQQ